MKKITKEDLEKILKLLENYNQIVEACCKSYRYESKTVPKYLMNTMALEGLKRGLIRELISLLGLELEDPDLLISVLWG